MHAQYDFSSRRNTSRVTGQSVPGASFRQRCLSKEKPFEQGTNTQWDDLREDCSRQRCSQCKGRSKFQSYRNSQTSSVAGEKLVWGTVAGGEREK